jgi:hypothetical protein
VARGPWGTNRAVARFHTFLRGSLVMPLAKPRPKAAAQPFTSRHKF